MNLRLEKETWLSIVTHALSARPYEACGLLVNDIGGLAEWSGADGGRDERWGGKGLVYVAVRNASPNPRDSFLVNPNDHLAVAGPGREVVGLVHSHPVGEARPSPLDMETFVPKRWWYLVVGMGLEGGQPFIGAWYRKGDGFERRELRIA